MIQGIHHIAIIVSNEDNVSFYRNLGFEVFKRVERQHDIVLLLSGHGVQLEIFVDGRHPQRSTPEPLGVRHWALRVDDIQKTGQALGVEIESAMNDWEGKRFCFISDPDGNIVELHE